ncbi:hypothetical protein, partial [Kineococcus indalonis]|uniref:hypothetical protein n=1 Tax=Kineococcus indalonis TaxID=2696566 RepID=UPI0014122091
MSTSRGPRVRAVLGVLVLVLVVTALLVRVPAPGDLDAQEEHGGRAAAPSRVLGTGVEVFSLWRDWPVNTTALQQVADSGSGWVRIG